MNSMTTSRTGEAISKLRECVVITEEDKDLLLAIKEREILFSTRS